MSGRPDVLIVSTDMPQEDVESGPLLIRQALRQLQKAAADEGFVLDGPLRISVECLIREKPEQPEVSA